jgi:hypothetical protein
MLQQLERALGFEVFHDPAADVRHEGEVLVVRGAGGAAEGGIQPGGVVVDHLVATDLKGGAVADEGDHKWEEIWRAGIWVAWGELGGCGKI